MMGAIFDKSLTDAWIVFVRVASTFLTALAISAFVAFLVFVIVYVAQRSKDGAKRAALVVLSLSVVAFLAGHLSGSSRTSVVGDVTPALLGGVGVLFMLSFVQGKVDLLLAGCCAVFFSFTFFFGVQLGVLHREAQQQAHLPEPDVEAGTVSGSNRASPSFRFLIEPDGPRPPCAGCD